MSEFLDYIGTKMIVVDKSERDKSAIVKRHLGVLLQKCEREENYAFIPDKEAAADEMSPGTTVNESFVETSLVPVSRSVRRKRKMCFLF